MSVEIEFKFPKWAEKLMEREAELNLFIAAQVQFNRGMLFDQEGAYNGHPRWADLKFRNGMILSKRGTLRKSIAPFNPNGTAGPDGIVRFAGDTIIVGTKLLYARLMNDGTTKMPGGVLRPVKAKALKIPLPEGKSATDLAKSLGSKARSKGHVEPQTGKAFIFRKSVKIPARPFDEWNETDQGEIDHALVNKVCEILNEGKTAP